MKLRLVLCSVILFVIALGFNVFFAVTSLEKLYIESIVSQYRVIGKDLQRNLERGLRYGKKLENFVGIESLMRKAEKSISLKIHKENSASKNSRVKLEEKDVSLSLVVPDGVVIHSSDAGLVKTNLPEPARKHFAGLTKDKRYSDDETYIRHQNAYITTIPVWDAFDGVAGAVVISFKETQIKKFLEEVFRKNIQPFAIICAGGIFLIVTMIHLLIPKGLSGNGISRKKVTLAIFIIISSAQILTSGWATREFKHHFLQISKENNEAINAQLKRDIEFLLGMGLRIDRLVKLDAYLGEVIRTSPEIKDINLFHHSNQPLYRATKEKTTDFQRSKDAYQEWVEATKPPAEIEYNHRNDITIGGEFKGYVSTNASKEVLFKKLIDIGMDFLAVIVISMLFFVEMLILIFKSFERSVESADSPPMTIHYGLMRPAAFLLLFGIDISVSFLPLHMETLYSPLFGLSKDTVMGLPISVEFLFVGISILISGVWLDRRGWHEPFICGLYLACAGLLYSWLAPDALHFIISRAVVGFGYGLSLMASQGFVIRYSDWKSKAQGLAHLFAGIYAGCICGAATGGMLAEWFGYHSVFLIGAFIVFSVFIYSIIFMRSGMRKPERQVKVQSAPSPKGKHLLAFLSNRTILGLVFLSSFPAAIAVIGFLNYFSPIYLNRIGASQSTIGQILMIYGICLIYFGPFISRYVDASQHKRTYIFIGCTLGSMSLLTFHVLGGISAAIVAIVLLGLSSSLVLASQSAYALQLKVTQQLGEGKAIGIFRSSSRVGQMLGPLVFSTVILATGSQQGLTYLGMAYLVTALLFLLFTQKETEETVFQYAESVEVAG